MCRVGRLTLLYQVHIPVRSSVLYNMSLLTVCIPDRLTSPVNEKLTLKRVVDFVKDKGDENLRDINRKMQRVLEETLTKNMHLQRVSVDLFHCRTYGFLLHKETAALCLL